MRRILVMRGGALGDFVLTLPVLGALRGRFPGARVEVLGYPRIACLAKEAGLAEEVHSIEAPGLARMFAAEAPVDKWFGGFDLVVSYIFDPEGIFEGNVRRSAPGARWVKGLHRPKEDGNRHAADVLLEPLKELGIGGADARPRLKLEGVREERDLLALHPGSGSARKNWPEEKWGELLGLILEGTKARCLLVGGEAEGGRLERLRGAMGMRGDRVLVAKDLPLPELARRLAGCGGFVGHDSGVTHLAAAVGLPGVILWGPSNEAVWRPRSERMTLVRQAEGLSRLPVHDVFGKLTDSGIVCPE